MLGGTSVESKPGVAIIEVAAGAPKSMLIQICFLVVPSLQSPDKLHGMTQVKTDLGD